MAKLSFEPHHKLRDLRDFQGKTQKEFARELGIQQSTLSMIEKGERTMSDSVISAAQFTFKLPPNFFYTPSASYSTGELNYRRKKLTKTQERMADKAFGFLESGVQEVCKDKSRSHSMDILKNRVRRISEREIAEVAQETRKNVGLSQGGRIHNVTRVIEHLGGTVVNLVNPNLPDGKVDGISSPRAEHYYPVVALSPDAPGDRRRFSAAHELGHLLLHGGQCALSHIDKEEEADIFAAEFLMPAREMKTLLENSLTLTGYAQLKAEWGVSIQSLIMRSKTLDVIDYPRYRSLFIQLSSRGWRTQEPVSIPVEHPTIDIAPLSDGSTRSCTGGECNSLAEGKVVELFTSKTQPDN